MKTGILLMNLGSPAAPRTPQLRRYLRQFLTDPRVIDLPTVPRHLLVRGIITPFRAPKSAAAYRSVWTDEGAPLIVLSKRLLSAVKAALPDVDVALAMRYGEPTIEQGLAELRAAGCDRVLLSPLYPHYASSSTGSSLAEAYHQAGKLWNTPFLSVLPPFFDDAQYIHALAETGRGILAELEPDHVLFSYHGLPERHCRKSDDTGAHCLASESCCDALVEANRNCYRAQCFATSRALQAALGLDDQVVTTTFQSRLGRDPWIRPYTDEAVEQLARDGVKKVAVFCPAFTADCLETIEEIGVEARESFQEHGGEELVLVPSLNDSAPWIEALISLCRRALPEGALG
ncbi:MAG: ferrochelatase [Planctomycetota bacterium]|jgi:ferrochelatase